MPEPLHNTHQSNRGDEKEGNRGTMKKKFLDKSRGLYDTMMMVEIRKLAVGMGWIVTKKVYRKQVFYSSVNNNSTFFSIKLGMDSKSPKDLNCFAVAWEGDFF